MAAKTICPYTCATKEILSMARRSCNIQQYFKQAANTAAAGNRPVATTLIISTILLTVRELTMSPRTPLCSDEAASLERGQLAKHPNSKEQTVPPSLIPVKVPSETSNNISKHQQRLGLQPSNKKLTVTKRSCLAIPGYLGWHHAHSSSLMYAESTLQVKIKKRT